MPPDPPVPQRALYHAVLGRIEVDFDVLLVPGATALSNWTGVALFGGQKWALRQNGPGVILGGQVRIPVDRFALTVGPSYVSYFATPPDVVSNLTGVAAWAFDKFPMTP